MLPGYRLEANGQAATHLPWVLAVDERESSASTPTGGRAALAFVEKQRCEGVLLLFVVVLHKAVSDKLVGDRGDGPQRGWLSRPRRGGTSRD